MRPRSQKTRGRQIKRWWWVAVLAAAVLTAGLWFLLRSRKPEDPTWDRVLETRVLGVCTDPSWLPFESVNPHTGRVEGLDADLARLLAVRLAPGVHAEIVTVGFDSLYDALLAGRCDTILSALPYDATRTRDVLYSIAYFNAGLVLVTRTPAAGIADLDDLKGRATGVEWGFVPEGSSSQRLLLSGLGLRRYDTAEDALRALESGELDAALVDHVSALAFMGRCPGLQIVGEPISDVSYAMAVRLDSVILLDQVNRVLLEMRQDGTLEELEDKWF